MRIIIALALAAILTMALHAHTIGYSWLAGMFSDNVSVVELYEDGSGLAIDNEGHKITFCIENAACDNSVNVYLPAMQKEN